MDTNADWLRLVKAVSRVVDALPAKVGALAVNFSKERFRLQNWADTTREAWPARGRTRRSAKRRQGAILVDTGRLRSSIRVTGNSRHYIAIGTDVPYARAHNYGYRGTVSIKAHKRRQFEKKTVSYRSRAGNTRSRTEQVATGQAGEVKAHTRRMNLPRRQYLGESAILTRRIERLMQAEFTNALKTA